MKKNIKSSFLIIGVASILIFALQVQISLAASLFSCTKLSYSLSSGSNDLKTNGEVTKLQLFLKGQGYLSATPNGNFGPATFAAVKKFQAANSISTTGTVGPLTRIAIHIKSCAEVSSAPIPSTATTTTSSTVNETTVSTTAAIKAVTSPTSGERLLIGQSFNVIWNGRGYGQDIVLEDENGTAQGFVAPSIGGASSFAWKVGTVFSSKVQDNVVVQPGTYRIRVRGTGADQISGLFTIDAPAMVVKYLAPSETIANGSSAIVAYGSGFQPTMAIFIDNRYATNAVKLYTSTDGKIVVFAIPSSVSAGNHEVIFDNSFGTSISAGHVTVTSSGSSQ